MGNPRLSKGKIITIVVVVVTLLILTALTGKERTRITFLENAVLTVFAPAQNLVSNITENTSDFVNSIRNYRQLLEENEAMREELDAAELLTAQLKEMRQENYRLRDLLDFKAKTSFEMLPAEVTGRNPNQWFEIITINKGSRQGVEKGMPVVTSRGLIGSVYTTALNSSHVLLLTDPSRGVSALVQRSREPGIVGTVEGLAEKEGYLMMRNLPPEANVQRGDTIISSGLGPLFPKGLVIGYVVEVGDDAYGLLKYALLEPAVNFNRIEEVFVVMEFPPEEEVEEEEEMEDDANGDEGEEG